MEIKYRADIKGDFFYTVNKKVNAYFDSNNLSRKTNAFGIFKAIFFCLVYAALFCAVIFADGNTRQLLAAFAAMGFIQICIVLNLGHEGVHSAFSKNKNLNHLLSYSFDLIGTSGYLWKMRHVYSHHPYPMIPDHDVDIQQTGMLTFLPMKNPKPAFRFQKFYVPFLYCGYTLNAIFKRDWEDFFSEKIGTKTVKHSRAEYATFIISKAIYFTYTLVLPLLLSGSAWYIVILGFVFMHVLASLTAAVALFPAHLYEDSVFPTPDEKGEVGDSWAEHQMRVTMDFGTRLPFVSFFFGGINYHAVHHLFPNIAHVHFPQIRKILHQTADEFGIDYKHKPSLNKAIYSHWLLLKKNGVAEMNEVF
jgi:linoleoyl-CoA desaturase